MSLAATWRSYAVMAAVCFVMVVISATFPVLWSIWWSIVWFVMGICAAVAAYLWRRLALWDATSEPHKPPDA